MRQLWFKCVNNDNDIYLTIKSEKMESQGSSKSRGHNDTLIGDWSPPTEFSDPSKVSFTWAVSVTDRVWFGFHLVLSATTFLFSRTRLDWATNLQLAASGQSNLFSSEDISPPPHLFVCGCVCHLRRLFIENQVSPSLKLSETAKCSYKIKVGE